MISLSSYKQNLQKRGTTEGEARKAESDIIMDATWDRDIQSRVCYLYDYYHDDQEDLNYNLDSPNSFVKIPIDAKFIVNSYNSDGRDQVSYHLQFKTTQECNVPYYEEKFVKRCGAEFPIGLINSPIYIFYMKTL